MTEASGPFLTVAELAGRLGVSETTGRNWRRWYGDLIASTTGIDGVRRYDLGGFRRIAVLRGRKLPRAAIRAALAEQRRADAETQPAPTFEEIVIARLDRLTLAVERIADRLDPPAEDG